jgi:DNA-binding IclR family transcriptional regulator
MLLGHHRALTLTAISNKLGRSKSGMHSILGTLRDRGFVERMPSGSYRLGTRAWDLGRASFSFEIGELARPELEGLEQRTGESVLLGVLDGFDVVYLLTLPGKHPVRVNVQSGERQPANLTSTGLALLAQLDDRQIHALLPDDFTVNNDQSIKSKSELLTEITHTRARGYGAMTGGWHQDVGGIARGVCDPDGNTAGAICVAAPLYRVDDTWRAMVKTELDVTVQAIERALASAGRTVE